MNYIYLALGLVLGVVFWGRGKNAKKRKFLPAEVRTKLSGTKKNKEEFEEWCDREALGCRLMGAGFGVFGISATFMDSVQTIGNIIAIASLLLFIAGFFIRALNNKKHLGHYFTK